MKETALRNLLSGADSKPLHVAAVKSRGDERWRKSGEEILLAGMDQRDERK